MRALALEHISVRGFRNLVSVDIDLSPRLNVIAGDNGQGKTNLLEAAYVVATSRSFRSARVSDLIAHGSEMASVRARVREDGEAREQSVGLQAGSRAVRIDGKRPPTLADYAVRTPTVVFHPGVMSLSAGAGAERRKLLDRVALFLSPSSLADTAAYLEASRARQRALETRGDGATDLDGWEELSVRHGLALMDARAAAAARLLPAAEIAFERIGSPGVTLAARYRPSAPADAGAFRAELARNRARDRARGSATVGPHRDDMLLHLAGRSARSTASQGQHRSIVLALEMAEIEVVAAARGVRPIMLLDDVSSELDRSRTSALFSALSEQRGQVLLTTTRPELIEASALLAVEDRRSFVVVQGRVEPL